MADRIGKNELLDRAGLIEILLKNPEVPNGVNGVFTTFNIVGAVEQTDGSTNYLLSTGNELMPLSSQEPYAKARRKLAEALAPSKCHPYTPSVDEAV